MKQTKHYTFWILCDYHLEDHTKYARTLITQQFGFFFFFFSITSYFKFLLSFYIFNKNNPLLKKIIVGIFVCLIGEVVNRKGVYKQFCCYCYCCFFHLMVMNNLHLCLSIMWWHLGCFCSVSFTGIVYTHFLLKIFTKHSVNLHLQEVKRIYLTCSYIDDHLEYYIDLKNLLWKRFECNSNSLSFSPTIEAFGIMIYRLQS